MISVNLPCQLGTRVTVLIDDGFHGSISFTGYIREYVISGITSRIWAIVENEEHVKEYRMIEVLDGKFIDVVKII